MKKASTIMRIIAASLVIVLGIFMMYFGFSGRYWYYGYWTDYEYYGGDAYTGIQQAAADTARNVDDLGDLVRNFANDTLKFSSILVVSVGLYLLALAFRDIEKKKPVAAQAATVTVPVEQPKENEIAQLEKYKALLDIGALTQEEFDAKKKQLLGL